MFEIDVLHWIAATLNPRTRMLKLATDVERIHAHSLVYSELAKKIFCIPASSAAVERAFSSAGVIITQRRNSISPSLVNDIILVRSAATYFKDVLRESS